MGIRQDQCNKVCRIIDDYLANRPRERDELIVAVRTVFKEADRKTEPQTEAWHDDCNTCRWHDGACTIPCCDYEPKDEPQTDLLVTEYPQDGEVNLIGRGKTEVVVMAYDVYKELTEPQKMCDADCNEDCAECAEEWQDWKDQMWTEAVIASKTEPQTEDKHAVCTGCDYYDLPNAFHPCASCVDFSKYKPKIEDEPQTDCSWKKGE